MAKFLIFAFVAFSVGWAESSQSEKDDDDKFDQEEVKSGLKDIFNLTPDDLKKECNVDFDSAWPTIGSAFDKLQTMSDGFDAEAEAHFKEDDPGYNEQVLAICRKSEPFKTEKINVIKAALPCASEDRVSELSKISEINTC